MTSSNDTRCAPGYQDSRAALFARPAMVLTAALSACAGPTTWKTVDGHQLAVSARTERGVEYAELNVWQAAKSDWDQALASNPNDPALLYDLGVAHERLGAQSDAAALYLRALRITLNDAHLSAYARVTRRTGAGASHLGYLIADAAGSRFAQHGLWREAVELWIPQCKAEVARACHNIGVAAEVAQRPEQAANHYQRAASLDHRAVYARAVARMRAATEKSSVRLNKPAPRVVAHVRSTVTAVARSGPGLSYPSLRVLPPNTELLTIESADGWSQVMLAGDRPAYVFSGMIAKGPAAPRIRTRATTEKHDQLTCTMVVASPGRRKADIDVPKQMDDAALEIHLERERNRLTAQTFNRANAHFDKGQWISAVEHYGRTLRYNPRLGVAHYNIGLAYYACGDTLRAVRSMKAACDADEIAGCTLASRLAN